MRRSHGAVLGVRRQLWPLLQTAAAAVIAWYLARAVLPDPQPSFAAIAAVIAIGATYAQRPGRALELTAGVVVGLSAADLLVQAIGTGPLQVGATASLAMLVAVLLGGGTLLVSEAGVSAILVTTLPPASAPIFPSRPLEAVIGAGVALAVTALAFPPDPRVHVVRAADNVLAGLGAALDDVAAGLEQRDESRAASGLRAARALDDDVRALGEALAVARDTARLAPSRRSARADLRRYGAAAPHVDHAVRNARVLARYGCHAARAPAAAPRELPCAVREVRSAVWELASELDAPERGSDLRRHAARATRMATTAYERERRLELAEVVVQVRSLAVDLVRAAEVAADRRAEVPTEELLVALPS